MFFRQDSVRHAIIEGFLEKMLSAKSKYVYGWKLKNNDFLKVKKGVEQLIKCDLDLTPPGSESVSEEMYSEEEEEKDRSFALSSFSLDEITHLKECIENKVEENDNLDEKTIQKIQAIKLTNEDWSKVEFEQGEVKCLKKFLTEKQEKELSAKLMEKIGIGDSSSDEDYHLDYQKKLEAITEQQSKRVTRSQSAKNPGTKEEIDTVSRLSSLNLGGKDEI